VEEGREAEEVDVADGGAGSGRVGSGSGGRVGVPSRCFKFQKFPFGKRSSVYTS